MNLVEKLLTLDAKKADELSEKKIKSKKLAEILGEKKPVEITIRELPTERVNYYVSMQFDEKGTLDTSKVFEVKALTAGEAVVEPDLKNKDLQEHFGCKTSKDLAIKLFRGEVGRISDAVAELSGMGEIEETDKEIKN